MKRIYSVLLAVIFAVSLSITAHASESTTITQDDYEEILKDQELEVTANKGSVFTVKVPILSSMTSSNWEKYKYNSYYWCASASVTGDIAANEQLTIDVEETLTMYPDGGLKDSIDWICFTEPTIVNGANLVTSERLNQQYGSVSFEILIKPNKDTTAGMWRGLIHSKVSLEERGVVLTEEQFKQYVCSDTTVTEVHIPKYINVNGLNHRIDGLGNNVFSSFTELTDVYLETDYQFSFSGSFRDRRGATYNSESITIHGNDIPVKIGGYAETNVPMYYEGCRLFLSQNPFYGMYDTTNKVGNGYYNYYVQDNIPADTLIGSDTGMGSWTELRLNPDVKALRYSAFGNSYIEKLYVPQLKYLNGKYDSYFEGSEVIEAEIDNYYVGERWFKDCTLLKKVVLTDNVEFIDSEAFSGCTSLTEVVIPESVKYIDPSAFSGTPFFENLKKGVEKVYINGCFIGYGELYHQDSYYEFPAEVDTLSNAFVSSSVTHLAFEETNDYVNIAGTFPNITKLDLTGRHMNVGTVTYNFPNVTHIILGGKTTSAGNYQNNTKITTIELVDGLSMIPDSTFNHVTNYSGSSLYIPKTVDYIGNYSTTYVVNSGSHTGRTGSGWGNHVFYDFGKDGVFKEFIVDEESQYYTDIDGILYTKDLEALVAIPRAYEFENGVFELPNEVKRLGELTFSRNNSIHELVISDNLEIFNNTTELENYYNNTFTGYVSCMNEGNSLSLAVYQFTDIKKYTTRDTNPNYVSIDGVLYTKDLKELVAVPHGYEGVLTIPEGCEVWRENALWLNYDSGRGVNDGITSIVIPSTMKSIDDKQLSYINSKYYVNNITVTEGNTNYAEYEEWIGIPRAVHKAQTLDSITYGGHTGTYWFSGWGSNANNIGADASTTCAAYLPIYIPEGEYSFKFDYHGEGDIRYKIIFGLSTGKVESTTASDVQINWTTGESTFTVGEGGRFMYIGATIVDSNNTHLVDAMTVELGQKIIDLFTVTKLCSHNYVGEVTTESTCTTLGVMTYTCSKCSENYTEDISKVPHEFEEGVCSVCYGVDVYHENAESGLYNADGGLLYSWDDLLSNNLISVNEGKIYQATFTEGSSLVVDDSITTIGGWLLDGKRDLTDIILPEGLKTIENAAFKDCGIIEIDIPSTVDTLGTSIFWGCTDLKKVSLPEGITEIPEYMFNACESLEELIIPSTVNTINTNIFYYTLNLTDVYFNMSGPITFNGESNLLREHGVISTYHFIDEETIKSIPYEVIKPEFTKFALNGEEYFPVMYNKDGTELCYVSPEYSGIIDVVEGCTTITDTAFVSSKSYPNITRLTIPVTVENISDNELAVINSKLASTKIVVQDGNRYFVKYSGSGHPAGLVRLLQYGSDEYALTGSTGYVWYNSNTMQMGASNDSGNNRKLQIFHMISMPEGTYEFSWDTEETMYWRLLVCKSSGYAEKSFCDANSVAYTSEKSAIVTFNETNNIAYLCATFIDAEGNYVTTPTAEQKEALVESLRITKVE